MPHIFKTILFLLITWSLFFGLAPWGIVFIERYMGWPSLHNEWLAIIGASLFIIFSAIGLWSSFVMARHGGRSPMPTGVSGRLVTTGPYKFVRNPISLSGMAQGLGIGLCWGSQSVIALVALYVIFWYFVVRPAEERALEATFGDEYRAYKNRVPAVWQF